RDRHGPVLGSAGDRRRCEDRLPARTGVGLADHLDVGLPTGPAARKAAAFHRRLALGRRGGGLGTGHRGARGLRARCPRGRPGGPDRAGARQPAADDEAPGQPVAVRPGTARHPGPGHCVRRRRAPHPRGLRLPGAGCPRGLPRRRTRTRRGLRRPRPLDVQGVRAVGTVATTTRARLLLAARELIEEGGYAAASVVAIAERAGVAAGTLYRHFDSKEELFATLFRAVCSREERAMRVAAATTDQAGGVARLEQVLATFAERALRNPRLAWALIAEPVDPLVDAERLSYRERYAGVVAGELQAAVDGGEVPEQDVELTAAALVGGCGEALVGPLSTAGARASDEEIVAALRTFVRRAVGAS